jgi:ADP-ribosylglycohydrolase
MGKIKILGALAGDIIGSPYEFYNTKSTDFELFTKWTEFTDDSVMTLAVAKWLMEDAEHSPSYLIRCMQELGRRYPRAGYGGNFNWWLRQENPQPYNSWGNGAGMRVSPVGLYANTIEEALELAEITASVSHNHPEGIKGAQAIASSVFLCKDGQSKQEIKAYVEQTFGYNLSRTIDEIRPNYSFDVSCQGSAPEAIIAFLEGNSFEEVIRLAISIGGDSDTIGCMAGAIAACRYSIPDDIAEKCDSFLTEDLRAIKDRFVDFIDKRSPYVIKLTRDNYKECIGLDIVAFSSAAGGAMGDAGAVQVVTSKGEVYYANPLYEDIDMEQVFEVCPPLSQCQFGIIGGGVIPEGWKTIYLGFGNHLVLHESICEEFRKEAEQSEIKRVGDLYKKWKGIVKRILANRNA